MLGPDLLSGRGWGDREVLKFKVTLGWVGLEIEPVIGAGKEVNVAGRMPCLGAPGCYGRCGKDEGALASEVITE